MPSPMEFRSRWVLVTGASSGLGREIARTLARDHGANLLLAARRTERIEALAQELADTGVSIVPITADLSRAEDVERLYAEATDGREVYGVVLNAGVTCFGPHHELPWEDVAALLATNVTSTVRLATLFLPHFLKQQDRGGMLLITSLAGIVPVPYQAAYSGSKGFLINFGRCLWHELRPEGVSVTTFVPGGISTELLDI
ncbi:MAG: SDR family NAD(P)-dependent oxidoreductase, partial [Myxococcales bacterium]|nr:SDR family NAD(P)-dependent oxidoreductase [Myxococcales bacterium]